MRGLEAIPHLDFWMKLLQNLFDLTKSSLSNLKDKIQEYWSSRGQSEAVSSSN